MQSSLTKKRLALLGWSLTYVTLFLCWPIIVMITQILSGNPQRLAYPPVMFVMILVCYLVSSLISDPITRKLESYAPQAKTLLGNRIYGLMLRILSHTKTLPQGLMLRAPFLLIALVGLVMSIIGNPQPWLLIVTFALTCMTLLALAMILTDFNYQKKGKQTQGHKKLS